MYKHKKRRLEAIGWTIGEPAEFLAMTDAERTVVEMKVSLADTIRRERTRQKITQSQLGRLLGSSQSRVAKMEAADRSVTIDLLVRSLLKLGVSRRDVALRMAASARGRRAAQAEADKNWG